MGYGDYLRRTLEPLGVYDLTAASLSGSEVDAMGRGLDGSAGALETAERESILTTAEGEGLDRWESLFAKRPVNYGPALRRQAVASLLRIGGDSFTLADINSAISGCGIRAEAQEMGGGHIRVIFPEVAGEPPEFSRIASIILDFIPCHLETEFYFRYITWQECEMAGYTWEQIQQVGHTWYSFELAV